MHVARAISGHQRPSAVIKGNDEGHQRPTSHADARTLSNTGIGITASKGVRFVKSKLKCVVIA